MIFITLLGPSREFKLAHLLFSPVDVKAMEIQAVPAGTRAWRGKTMRPDSFLGPGGPLLAWFRAAGRSFSEIMGFPL